MAQTEILCSIDLPVTHSIYVTILMYVGDGSISPVSQSQSKLLIYYQYNKAISVQAAATFMPNLRFSAKNCGPVAKQ
jgi:hypothetical protein